jgi:hypothetical protein
MNMAFGAFELHSFRAVRAGLLASVLVVGLAACTGGTDVDESADVTSQEQPVATFPVGDHDVPAALADATSELKQQSVEPVDSANVSANEEDDASADALADDTTWACELNGFWKGDVTIWWGHRASDARWACNNWISACQRACLAFQYI